MCWFIYLHLTYIKLTFVKKDSDTAVTNRFHRLPRVLLNTMKANRRTKRGCRSPYCKEWQGLVTWCSTQKQHFVLFSMQICRLILHKSWSSYASMTNANVRSYIADFVPLASFSYLLCFSCFKLSRGYCEAIQCPGNTVDRHSGRLDSTHSSYIQFTYQFHIRKSMEQRRFWEPNKSSTCQEVYSILWKEKHH